MDFELSADEQYALMYIYTKSKYRHSFYADYILVDLLVIFGLIERICVCIHF